MNQTIENQKQEIRRLQEGLAKTERELRRQRDKEKDWRRRYLALAAKK